MKTSPPILSDTTLACCVCGATEAVAWRTGRDRLLGGEETFRAVRCARCGTRRLDPRPPESDMARYYAPATYARAEGEDSEVGKRLDAYTARLADRADELIAPCEGAAVRRALDVGCGDGRFLGQLRARGWQVAGTETDPVAAALARRRTENAPVHEGPLETLAGPDAAFDLVSLVHVLEHVPDPRAALARCLRLLRPGGALLLALPNAASAEAEVFGSAWYHLDLPRHLWGFTPQSLTRLVEEVGFSVRGLAYTPLLFAPQSVLNVLKPSSPRPSPPSPLPRRERGAWGTGGIGSTEEQIPYGDRHPSPAAGEGTGVRAVPPDSLKTRVFAALLRASDGWGKAMPGEIMEMTAVRPGGAGR